MNAFDDLLLEIHTEELPPKSLRMLGEAFAARIKEQLQKNALAFERVTFFATPRRLAVYVERLASMQPNQTVERKGPALKVAFDEQGEPSKACVGFARSVGVSPKELSVIKNQGGEWVAFQQKVPGQSVTTLLPTLIEQAIATLPIPKRMRWGAGETEFVRSVHSVIVLFGDQIIPCTILGLQAGRVTRGHRFLAPDWITIPHAAAYESLLETEGFVIADFEKRREHIQQGIDSILKKSLDGKGNVYMTEALLDEVTGLVEWPVALCGRFDDNFLALPEEVLISSMVDHQRYFPIRNTIDHHLLPHFIVISNIDSHEPQRVIHGNERVLRARLADAEFFYATDQKEAVEDRLERLKGMVFQTKLGTLYDKCQRLALIAAHFAKPMKVNEQPAARAGLLAKHDLTTQMVGEFPELQGVMGYYYAKQAGEPNEVALAIKEHYLPRFAGDTLPQQPLSQLLAIADRVDTLTGIFAINQLPTGDKDPYGLRRAAIGLIRILVENEIDLDLKALIQFTLSCYQLKDENPDTVNLLLNFIQERQRTWYQDQGITPDVFASVAALGITNPLDMHKRVLAVQTFKKMQAAERLSIANKRVSNILAQNIKAVQLKKIDAKLFESPAEERLAHELELKSKAVAEFYQGRDYDQVLLQLAGLSQPIDDFFDQVMVMTEDTSRRENRILLLDKLRSLFLQVADIALLQ